MSVVVFVSSARERFCRGVSSSLPRVAAALLSFVLILGTCAAAYAGSSSPSVTIDYDRLPTISVDAKGATVREILTQLADRLHFQIENPQAVENSPTFSGSFTGDLTDVLRRVLLRDVNYAIMYRELAIERIVIVGSSTADAGGVKPSSSGNVAGADNVRPTDTATAETSWTRPRRLILPKPLRSEIHWRDCWKHKRTLQSRQCDKATLPATRMVRELPRRPDRRFGQALRPARHSCRWPR